MVHHVMQVPELVLTAVGVDVPVHMQVLPKPAGSEDAASSLVAWVRQHFPNGDSGIVYCLTRKVSNPGRPALGIHFAQAWCINQRLVPHCSAELISMMVRWKT